jgi:hypothetical protein
MDRIEHSDFQSYLDTYSHHNDTQCDIDCYNKTISDGKIYDDLKNFGGFRDANNILHSDFNLGIDLFTLQPHEYKEKTIVTAFDKINL